MEMTQHSLSWFEIPTIDFERARTFYGAIFDLDMPVMEMCTNLMGFSFTCASRGGAATSYQALA